MPGNGEADGDNLSPGAAGRDHDRAADRVAVRELPAPQVYGPQPPDGFTPTWRRSRFSRMR